MIYLIAFVLTLLFSSFYLRERAFVTSRPFNFGIEKNRKISQVTLVEFVTFLLAVFPVWFITSFRYDVGTDYLYTYVKFFEYTQLGQTPYKEPLFQLLNNVLVSLNLDYVWLFAFCGAVINILVFKLIFQYSDNPLLSIVVYFCAAIFFNTLNNVRQYFALTIAAFSLFQNKNWKSVLIIFFAGLFHFSAFLFLAFWLFTKIKLKRMGYLLLTVISIACLPILLSVALKILENTKYNYFIGYSDGYSLLTIIINIVVFILTLLYYDKNDKKYMILAKMQLITFLFCLCSVLMQNEEFWMRFIRMTAYFHIILVPLIAKKEKRKTVRGLVAGGIVILYTVYTIYTVYLYGGLEVFPYQFIF